MAKKNKFTDCEKRLTEADLTDVENRLAIQLPQPLKAHYLIYNGGIPKRPCWEYLEGEFYQVVDFKPIKYVADPMDDEYLAAFDTLEGTYERQVKDGVLNAAYLPFASDLGNNYFCVHLPTNEVVYYAMDTDVEPIRILSSGFQEFIDGLVDCDAA